jgi:mono/diheme cytochrome c family protein
MKRTQLYQILRIAALMGSLIGGASPALAGDESAQPPGSETASAKVERGRYIVTTSGCHDCHTPWKPGANGPEPDMTRMLSGHPQDAALPSPPAPAGPWIVSGSDTNTAWSGPWGISFTANLTPDPATGLGTWSLRNFVETIRTGRHMGRGRVILPPMPIPMYKHFTDADLEAIFTYLQSIPPIVNQVPEPVPPADAAD